MEHPPISPELLMAAEYEETQQQSAARHNRSDLSNQIWLDGQAVAPPELRPRGKETLAIQLNSCGSARMQKLVKH